MSEPTLTLLVLRTSRLDALRAFYTALGLDFVAEQHGRGPLHYAARLGGTVFELYPQTSGAAADLPDRPAPETRLGFAVAQLEETLAELQALGAVVGPINSTAWGEQALARDPDGRPVEVSRQCPT